MKPQRDMVQKAVATDSSSYTAREASELYWNQREVNVADWVRYKVIQSITMQLKK